MHIGLGQGHRVKVQRRLYLDIVGGHRLGNVLLVLLAFFGYVDHEVA